MLAARIRVFASVPVPQAFELPVDLEGRWCGGLAARRACLCLAVLAARGPLDIAPPGAEGFALPQAKPEAHRPAGAVALGRGDLQDGASFIFIERLHLGLIGRRRVDKGGDIAPHDSSPHGDPIVAVMPGQPQRAAARGGGVSPGDGPVRDLPGAPNRYGQVDAKSVYGFTAWGPQVDWSGDCVMFTGLAWWRAGQKIHHDANAATAPCSRQPTPP